MVVMPETSRDPGADPGRTSFPARLGDVIIVAAVCVLGFILTFKSGMRGFYPFDQSIVFDGSYRVASGQVPYRDFVMPFGPVTFWLHAVFFKVLGVSYFSYVFGAALINVLAVVASAGLVRLLFPSCRALAYLAAAVTAVWFYPPFGTPWVDQTAFFFSYLGLLALLAGAKQTRPRRGDLLAALSGVAAFLAMLSKQNAGLFMLPAYPVVIVAAWLIERRGLARRLGWFGAGLGLSAAAFFLYLGLGSDLATFNRYVLGLASGLGRERLAALVATRFGIAQPYFGDRVPLVVNAALAASAAVSLVALVLAWRRGRARARAGPVVAAVLCLYLLLFQHVFMNTTLNQQENSCAFAGPIIALAAGLLLMIGRKARRARVALWVLAVAATVAVSAYGVGISLDRKVHDIFRGDRFARPIKIEGLEGLRWAVPMRLRGFDIFEQDFLSLVAYLRERRENFLVFPDFTILYGLVGVPSPQPLLWFHEGVTYRKGETSDLDARIVRDLERNRVNIVVIEQVAWFNTGERLADFPGLERYIYGSFTRLGQIGTFSIYERGRPESATAGPATSPVGN
jgi:hypothetical protein